VAIVPVVLEPFQVVQEGRDVDSSQEGMGDGLPFMSNADSTVFLFLHNLHSFAPRTTTSNKPAQPYR
jgi:hypothetical protein